MARVFVYGTLRRGQHAHHLIEVANGEFVNEVRTLPKYHLYDVGSFPGMIEDDSVQGPGIVGEVWNISESGFGRLDRYECVEGGLFRRGQVQLEDGTTANAYFFTSDMSRAKKVESGVWQ